MCVQGVIRCPLLLGSLSDMIKIHWMLLPSVIQQEGRQAHERTMVIPSPPYSLAMVLCDFWLCPKIKMTMKREHFELVEDIEAARTSQIKTLIKNYFIKRTASDNNSDNGIKMCKARVSILMGINGNVIFILVNF